MTSPRRIHDVDELNARLQEITRRVQIDMRFLHDDQSRAYVVEATRGAGRVLDVGDGMRGHRAAIESTIESLDLNDIDSAAENLTRPDILGDVCQPFPEWMAERYDAVVALAVLEHVYDPPAAVANFRRSLRPGGQLFLYVPWMWRYHAPRSLVFQDYQRLSRDGLAYLLRDFDDVTLFPIRGKYTSILNMLKVWKRGIERRTGPWLGRLIDARTSDFRNTVQASGYFVHARSPTD
ncbi:MAG: methyltransferase domain-containing protein [Pseudomonadota bacterium]